MRKPCNRLMLVRIIGSTLVTVTLFNFTYASQLRLVAGRTSSQGRLEIYVNGEWGTVCDDSWDLADAHVACRQLGFPVGAVKATSGGFYPGGTGPIHLDDVDCRGYESDLVDCDHRGIGSHNCGHGEDAGVLCNTGVRLVGSSSSMDGRVEVLWNGAWGTVCDDQWDLNDATVVCRQLGFLGAWEASTSATFGAGIFLAIMLDNVACTGNEETLFDCGHDGLEEHNCGHSEDAGVRCVDMRLVAGDTINEGRLELLLNDEWGTVCDDLWGQEEAQVACRQLGFPSAIEATSRASFGIGVGSIHLDNVECTGSERNLLSCQHNEIGENNCGHGEDAGIICNPDKLRLVGGASTKEGRLEIFLNGEWGTVCDDSWDIEDARVACRQLGFSGAVEATQGATFGSGSGPIYLDDVACSGHENDLMTCEHNGIGVENCGHSEDAGVICGITVEIRLVGGDTKNEGRLELLHNGEWGTVCDDSWEIEDAQVACRQLGFPSAIEATSRASFGVGVGSIHLDNVECTGSESNLLSCQHNEIGENDCDHSEDAGVVCNPDILRLVGAASTNEGRLEIFLNGAWGTVCDDSWDIEDARVACRQLGFPGAVEATQGGSFGSGSGPIYLDDVACGGHENDLMNCVHSGIGVENCDHTEDAGVICGPTEPCFSGPCAHGASCINLSDGFTCHCPDGYGGVACAEDLTITSTSSIIVAHCATSLDHSDHLMVVSGQQAVYLPGDSVEYDCPDGYHLSGSATRFCQSDLTWSGQPAECNINFCANEPCANGATCFNALDGFTCSCPDGYDGLTCADVSHCAPTSDPSDVLIVVAGQKAVYLPGDVVEYDCPDGYYLSGSALRICQLDFTWSGQPAECNREPCFSEPCLNGATCIDAPSGFACLCPAGYGGVTCAEVAHCVTSFSESSVLMVVSDQQAVYIPGDSVEYDCPNGYHLSGSATRFCQSDLTWSGQPAECNRNFCVNEPCMNEATCTSALDGFICSCLAGYDGLTCADVAHCVPTSDPSDVLTVVSGQQALYLPGDSVEYDCPDGYHLSGSAVRYCQSDFSWSGQQVECSRVASCMVSLNESDVLFVASSQQAMYVPGDSVEYACPAGYHLNGSAIRICQPDFSWSGQPAACSQDSCIDEPCANGATCISTPSGFNCLCTAAYDGLTCEHVLAAQEIQRKTSSPVVLIMGGGGGALVFIAVLFVVITVLNRRKSRPQTNFPFHTGLTTEIGCVELSEFTSTTAACAGPPSPIYHETIADAGAADDHLYAEVPRRGLPLPPLPSKIVDEEADGTYCNMKNLF